MRILSLPCFENFVMFQEQVSFGFVAHRCKFTSDAHEAKYRTKKTMGSRLLNILCQSCKR
ncbi:uncharacterized protein LOC143151698 isoform X3 [Ptiloglossa arizonensis]|uniref:uncharacterized protein LOC143151698 isoform X3 n=1 Tax=Ptiloglossa arizonensis TaxID=3350558 RepID=UPI003FA0297E